MNALVLMRVRHLAVDSACFRTTVLVDVCHVIRGVPPPVVPALAIDARAKMTLVDDSCALPFVGDDGAYVD